MNYKKEERRSQERKLGRVAKRNKIKIEKLQRYLLPEIPILEDIPNSYENSFIICLQEFNRYLATLPYKDQIRISQRLFLFLKEIEEILLLNKKKFKSGFTKTIKEDYCSKKGLIAYGFGPDKDLSIDDTQKLRQLFKNCSQNSLEINEIFFKSIYKENSDVLVKFYSLKKIAYIPYTCRSVCCPYCSWQNSRKRFAHVFAFLKNLFNRKFKGTFITLTTPNHSFLETPKAVNELFNLLEKLYNFKLGKRNLDRFHKKALIELGKYLANLHKKLSQKYKQKYPKSYILFTNHDVWRKKKEHLKILNETIRFVRKHLNKPDSLRRFGLIFESIWKFEIKKNEKRNDFNSHWHGICLNPISRFFLKAITDYLGFGPIIDVRRVKGEEAIRELTKYETKNVFSGKDVTFLEKVIINASLTYRKRFRLWLKLNKRKELKEKLELIKNKDKDNLRYIVPKGETAFLDLKVPLRSISTVYRILRDKFPEDFEKVEIGKLTYDVPLELKKLRFKPFKLPVSIDKEAKFVVTGRGLFFVEGVLKVTGKYEKFVKALFLRDLKELKEVYEGNVSKFLIDKRYLKPRKLKKLEELEREKNKKRFLFIDLTNFEKYLREKVLELPSQIEERIIPVPGPPPPDMVLDLDFNFGF